MLAVDVGNTNITLGVYRDRNLLTHWRVSTQRHRTSDEYGILFIQLFKYDGLSLDDVDAAAICSVVPPLTAPIEEMFRRFFKVEPLIVDLSVKTGIVVKYDNPQEVGADRIVNAVAAFKKYGGPVIVVDFGTATTFDVISAAGEYLGGAIAPGIGISTDALYVRAAKLPKIELVTPAAAIGRNTVSSMQSGIIFGYAGQVDGLIGRIETELGGSARVIATGGLVGLVSDETRTIQVIEPWLTLEGLRIIYDMNKADRLQGRECKSGC